MPLSGKLSLGLSEKLGEEVGSNLINEFNAMETARQSEFQAVRLDIAGLRAELKGDLAGLRAEVKGDMAGLRSELQVGLGRLETKIADVQSELIKWVFVPAVF